MVSCADWSHWTLALLQWTVEKLEDGNYHLSLEEAGHRFFIQGAGEDLIGSHPTTTRCLVHPGTAWTDSTR
jgi:hypothetical protein